MSKETIMKFRTDQFVAPKDSDLRWIFIDQPGKEGPKGENGEPGKFRLVASLVLKTDSDGCKKLIKAIDAYLKDTKPKGMKVKSRGYSVIQEKTGEVDKDDVPIMRETDETVFQFWTGTHWKDGKEVVVAIHNAKGKKVSLGGKKIGNGSQGSISGAMDIYIHSGSCGVSLYLTAIQLTKFIEYAEDAGFEEVESGDDEDAGFDGIESDFEGTSSDSSEDAKPRL